MYADNGEDQHQNEPVILTRYEAQEELIKESFKDFIQRSIADFEAEMLKQQTLKELIGYMVFKEKETYRGLSPVLIKELMVDNPEMYAHIQEQYDKSIVPLMVKMVEDGKARGEISSKVSVEAVLLLIQVYMKSSGEMLDAVGKHEDRETILEELMHLFFYGLCGQELMNG